MIYFDNAATTYPKPQSLKISAANAVDNYGGNPGRSGHKISVKVSEAIFSVRSMVAEMFYAEPENVVFTLNCTHALNFAIKGVMKNSGHIIMSSLEHNAVSRPIHAMSKKGINYSIADVDTDDEITIRNFERLIRPETKAIACTIASNVTGQILPYKKIGELCKKHHICFIADGAQACGVLPITLDDGINILCTAGHKGLYGPTGTGLLITDGKFELNHIIEGGTGATSEELEQTTFLPEMLESGTVNSLGILMLKQGLGFVRKQGLSKIYSHEESLCKLFISLIYKIPNIIIYRKPYVKYVPIVSFNIKGMKAPELSGLLDEQGFALRGGLHCACIAHSHNGTIDSGTVRFSPSTFNKEQEVRMLAGSLKKITENIR